MTRVIVHAGYHKTGTTSLQDFFNDNRALLEPYLQYYGKNAFDNAGAMARIYAQRPFPWRLRKFRKSFRNFLAKAPEGKTILLSRETFSGGMPGHLKLSGAVMNAYFPAARKLAQVIVVELQHRFGQQVDITFFYTTREREAWIKSIHGHLLRSIKLKQDFKTFRAGFPTLASPEKEAQRMVGVLAPIPVVTSALETFGTHREGPASALLDLVNIPDDVRAKLAPAKRANIGQTAELRASFLHLNQQGLDRSALKAAKENLMREDQKNEC